MNISKNRTSNFKSNTNIFMINEQIRDKEIRLIESDGNMEGITPLEVALDKAANQNLDLVKIAPQATPPVCKIMDYGKYLFELSKKDKEARKKQKTINIKEIRISASIEEHDFAFKAKNANKFLKDGAKVKVNVKFRGREMHYTSLGKEMLAKFAEAVEEYGVIEKKPKLEGRNMIMILSPKQQ